MGRKTIRITRKDGSPVVGQAVKFDMQKHEFLFGGGMFEAVEYASGEM